jgi:hypothetical protein
MGSEMAIILGLKVLSDIAMMITMGMPKTEGMDDNQKLAVLKTQQETTAKLVADLMAMAAK